VLGSFPGIKRLEHPLTSEVKNGWIDNSTSPILFHDNFTVTYVVWTKRGCFTPLLLSFSFWFRRFSLYFAFSVLEDSRRGELGDRK
jgi:hypothetical protein